MWLTKFDWVFCCLTAPGIVHCLENFLNVFPQSGLNSARLHSEAGSMSSPLPHHFCNTFSGKVRESYFACVFLTLDISIQFEIQQLQSLFHWNFLMQQWCGKLRSVFANANRERKGSHVFANILQIHWFNITLALTHNWIEWITARYVGFLRLMARVCVAGSVTNPF